MVEITAKISSKNQITVDFEREIEEVTAEEIERLARRGS